MSAILIKLGGSIVTRKNESLPCFNRENVSRIAEDIAAFVGKSRSRLVIVHGAGSYGHPVAAKYKLSKGLGGNTVPFAECQARVNQLNSLICIEFAAKNVPAYPFQVSAGSIGSNGTLKDFNVGLIEKLLDVGVVPVLFGTPAYDETQGCSIISGDQIMNRLASGLKASRVVFATDVGGLFNRNPTLHKDARLLTSLSGEELENIEAGASPSTDVTGGMNGKIRWIRTMEGLECRIINGTVPGNLAKALSGDDGVGTVIRL